MFKENKMPKENKVINPVQNRIIDNYSCICFRSSYYYYQYYYSYKVYTRWCENIYSRDIRGSFRICLNKVK